MERQWRTIKTPRYNRVGVKCSIKQSFFALIGSNCRSPKKTSVSRQSTLKVLGKNCNLRPHNLKRHTFHLKGVVVLSWSVMSLVSINPCTMISRKSTKTWSDLLLKMESPWLDTSGYWVTAHTRKPNWWNSPRNFQNSGGNRLWRKARGHMRCKTVDTLHSCARKNRERCPTSRAATKRCLWMCSERVGNFEPRKRPFVRSRDMVSIMLIWLI